MNRGAVSFILLFILILAGVAEARAPRIGDTIAPFQLPNIAGRAVDTARYNGKVVVVYFWTDACGCKEQMIELRPYLTGQKNRQIAFLAVNVGQEKSKVERFIADNKLSYEVLLDDKARLAREQFGIKVLPTIFIISKDGILREKLIGVVDTKKLQAMIGRYL
jgi:peroxiredoxin